MTELRCHNRLHAKASGPLMEVICRDRSRTASAGEPKWNVYRRWTWHRGRWVRLPDRSKQRIERKR